MSWEITKTYGHDLGLSCCFRQWKSESHCRFLHGYALSFSFVFRRPSSGLDDRHWVIDYGDLKDVKKWLQENFDHKTVAALDDPELEKLKEMHENGLVDLRIVPKVSTELFAMEAGIFVEKWLAAHHPEVMLVKSEVREHGANAATWLPKVGLTRERIAKAEASSSQEDAAGVFENLLSQLVDGLEMPPKTTSKNDAEAFDNLLGQLTDELEMPPKKSRKRPASKKPEASFGEFVESFSKRVDEFVARNKEMSDTDKDLWDQLRKLLEGSGES